MERIPAKQISLEGCACLALAWNQEQFNSLRMQIQNILVL